MKTTEELARWAGHDVGWYDWIPSDMMMRILNRFRVLVRDETLEEAATKIEYGAYPWASENSDTYHIQAEWTKHMQAKVRSLKT